MKIVREERKGGIYAQWFEVLGYNPNKQRVRYLIYPNQANTFEEAEKYFNDNWGNKGHIGIELRNAAPFDKDIICC